MQKSRSFYWLIAILAACLALSAGVATAQPQGGSGNPGILPPNSRPHGLTYGEWSARWWQWAFSIEKSKNPIVHDNADCGIKQSGHVWFLAGKGFGASGVGVRYCTVPTGTYLFFPVVNAVFDNTDVNPTTGELRWYDPWISPEQLRIFLAGYTDTITDFSCYIDGRLVNGLESMTSPRSPYRVQSPVFSITIPVTPVLRDNLYEIDLTKAWPAPPAPYSSTPKGTVPGAVSEGAYLMLNPLTPGQHTIRIVAGGMFDVTYFLTVEPGNRK